MCLSIKMYTHRCVYATAESYKYKEICMSVCMCLHVCVSGHVPAVNASTSVCVKAARVCAFKTDRQP